MRLSEVLFFTLIAGVVTLALCPWIISGLSRHDIVDDSEARSMHEGTVPRGGGLALLLGITASLLVALPSWVDDRYMVATFAVAGGFALLGLADDLKPMRPEVRLGVQLALVAIFLVTIDPRFSTVPAPFGLVLAGIWIAGFVNTFNFMDGIDGISAASAVIIGGSLALASWRWDGGVELPAAVLAGAAAGFLPYNAPRARAFLGDVGSYLIGSMLGISAVVAVFQGVPYLAVFLPFSLYTADVCFTLVRRARRREPILQPHKQHTYQLLVQQRLSHQQATLLISALTITLVALGQMSAVNSGLAWAAVGFAAVLNGWYLHLVDYSLAR